MELKIKELELKIGPVPKIVSAILAASVVAADILSRLGVI